MRTNRTESNSDIWPAGTTGDQGLDVFFTFAGTMGLAFLPGSRVLEVGSCECDWADRIVRLCPGVQVTTIDVRRKLDSPPEANPRHLQADVLRWEPMERYDWVVFIGSLEHIGLGHYGDPLDPDGDTHALVRSLTWLRPGGSIYYDVPYRPDRFFANYQGYRVYTAQELVTRLCPVGTGVQVWHHYDAETFQPVNAPTQLPGMRDGYDRSAYLRSMSRQFDVYVACGLRREEGVHDAARPV